MMPVAYDYASKSKPKYCVLSMNKAESQTDYFHAIILYVDDTGLIQYKYFPSTKGVDTLQKETEAWIKQNLFNDFDKPKPRAPRQLPIGWI